MSEWYDRTLVRLDQIERNLIRINRVLWAYRIILFVAVAWIVWRH